MKRNPISVGESPIQGGINVVLITLDHHMTGAVEEARKALAADLPKTKNGSCTDPFQFWWAMVVSNHRPPRCQRGALPLS